MARANRQRKRKHRAHRPTEIGPRTFLRGRWRWVDMRFAGGKREAVRDPKHPNWPYDGDRTTDEETAKRWAWKYLDHYRVDAKRRHLGLRGPSKPLGSEVTRFLAHRERASAIMTYLGNSTALSVHLVPMLGKDVATDTIDKERMQSWVDQLIDKGYKPSTVREYLKTAQTFFRWRSSDAHDPTKGVELVDDGERDIAPWTDAEIEKLRKAADALDAKHNTPSARALVRSYRVLLELGLGTGCRLAEMGALTWDAFDADDKTVRVRAQIPPDGYGVTLQPLKGRRNRTALVLPNWWAHHDEKAVGRVVLSAGVESCAQRSLGSYVSRIIETAKLKDVGRNAHSLRHTYARLALEGGARLEELQRFLGHASISTTEQHYGWMTDQAATTLARSRIYGETLRLVKPKRSHRAVG